MELIDILKQAKQELVVRGRTTNDLINGKGQVCPLGAIGVVVDPGFAEYPDYRLLRPDGEAGPAVEELAKYLPADLYSNNRFEYYQAYENVYAFNDGYESWLPREEKDEMVLDLFDRAIAGLEVSA